MPGASGRSPRIGAAFRPGAGAARRPLWQGCRVRWQDRHAPADAAGPASGPGDGVPPGSGGPGPPAVGADRSPRAPPAARRPPPPPGGRSRPGGSPGGGPVRPGGTAPGAPGTPLACPRAPPRRSARRGLPGRRPPGPRAPRPPGSRPRRETRARPAPGYTPRRSRRRRRPKGGWRRGPRTASRPRRTAGERPAGPPPRVEARAAGPPANTGPTGPQAAGSGGGSPAAARDRSPYLTIFSQRFLLSMSAWRAAALSLPP